MLKSLLEIGLPLLWVSFWMLGGIWLAQGVFNLRRNEQVLVGISLGLLLQVWLTSLFSRFFSVPWVDLLSAGVVFALGLFLILRQRKPLIKSFPLTLDWVFLILLAFLFFNIQHGLGIRNDLYYLSFTSRVAAGDIFRVAATDPPASLPLVFAGQLQRLAAIFPWNALDLARSLLMALGILLAGAWTRRLTHSQAAGVIGSVIAAFGMGTSWLLLVFPNPFLQAFVMPTLSFVSAPFPLADNFTNTLFQPLLFSFDPNTLMGFVLLACLLFTFNHWRQPIAGFFSSSILFASLLLIFSNTASFIFAWLVILIAWSIIHRSIRFPAKLWAGLGIFVLACCLAFWYRGIIFGLDWPEVILDNLNLYPGIVLVFLLQAIPAVCVLPLFVPWAVKAFQASRWFEVSLWISSFFAPLGYAFFFTYPHIVYQYFSYLSEFLWFMVMFFGSALIWNWAAHRSQSHKILAASLGLVTVLSGLFTFAILLTGLTQNILPPGLASLDAQVYSDYWNRPDLLDGPIFDLYGERGQVIFGRYINVDFPGLLFPDAIHKTKIHYLFFDETSWNKLDSKTQVSLNSPCVKLVKEYKAKRGDAFRRLLDVSACQ
jgi:hypothetical protein